MRFLIRPLSLFVLLAATISLHADTVFNLTGQSISGLPVGGTLTINTADGEVTSANVFFTFFDFDIVVDQISEDFNPGQPATFIELASSDPALGLDLSWPMLSLVGYDGGELCSTSNFVGGYCSSPLFQQGQEIDGLSYGNLEPATSPAVPEPSTLAFVSTGLLAAAEMVRRKRNV